MITWKNTLFFCYNLCFKVSFVFCYNLCFKVYFVWYKYCYQFFFPSICMINVFTSFHFQSADFFRSVMSLLYAEYRWVLLFCTFISPCVFVPFSAFIIKVIIDKYALTAILLLVLQLYFFSVPFFLALFPCSLMAFFSDMLGFLSLYFLQFHYRFFYLWLPLGLYITYYVYRNLY